MKKWIVLFTFIVVSLCSQEWIKPCLPCEMNSLNFLNVNSCSNFTIKTDYLYWKAYADALDWGASELLYFAQVNNEEFRNDLRIYNARFHWESSFRISTGFSKSEWDAYARWTFYRSKGKNYVTSKINKPNGYAGTSQRLPINIWPQGAFNPDFLSSNHWFFYNSIDFEIGKSIYVTKHLLLRPFLGLRGARILQRMLIKGNLLIPSSDLILSSKDKLSNDFLGAGPRIGGDAKWHINRFFNLYGMTSVSLLGGRFDIKESDYFNFSDLPFNIIHSVNRFKHDTFRPNLEFAFGMEFYKEFCQTAYGLDIGYEFHIWPHQTQLFRLYNNPVALKQIGNVSMHGLVISGAFYY